MPVSPYIPPPHEPSNVFARAHAQLKAMEAAHDQLPPLTSYRGGWVARLERWIKRRAGRATRWFTFEQVNFNSAVYATLAEVFVLLERHEAQQAQEAAQRQTELLAAHAELGARIAGIERQLSAALAAEASRLRADLAAELSDVRQARLNQIAEEHRIGYKQLQLRLDETASFTDRAHRYAQMRLDELARHVETLRALHADLRHSLNTPEDDEHPRPSAALNSSRSVCETTPVKPTFER